MHAVKERKRECRDGRRNNQVGMSSIAERPATNDLVPCWLNG